MNTNKAIAIATGIIFVALCVYMGIQNRHINRLQRQNQLQSVELSVLSDSVAIHKSKAGELTYKLTSVEVERENLRGALETAGYSIRELKARDVEWRKITSALQMQLESAGNGATTIADTFIVNHTDTVLFGRFAWSNNHLTLNGTLTADTLQFGYRYRTGISIVHEQQRRQTVVSVALTDPQATITTGNHIAITRETRWWEKPWLWGLAGFAGGIIISK